MMCLPILEGLMGTAHGAEELGLCSHGLACQAGVCGRYIGFSLGLPSATPDCHNRNRHNSVKNLVRVSILSTYCSQSQGASFAPIWVAWGNFLLLRNVTISEIYCTRQHTLIVRQIRPSVENEESFRKFGHGGNTWNSIPRVTTVTDF